MKNESLIRWTIIGLVVLTLVVVMAMVLLGENGIVRQEIKKYNDTHVEEVQKREIKKNK